MGSVPVQVLSGARRGSEGSTFSFAKFLCEHIRWDCGILDVSPLLGSASAWMYVPNKSTTRIAGEKFIFGGGLVVE